MPEKQAAASYFDVERTTSEFLLSAYGSGGATTNIPGIPWAEKCQDCHMRDVNGTGCNKKGAPVRADLSLHGLTGGNQWILNILASVDLDSPTFDPYNYLILSGQKYEGIQIDTGGLRKHSRKAKNDFARSLKIHMISSVKYRPTVKSCTSAPACRTYWVMFQMKVWVPALKYLILFIRMIAKLP